MKNRTWGISGVVLNRQPRSYWGVIFAAGLALAPISGQAQQQTEGTEEQPTAQEQPVQALPIPLPVEIVEDQTTAETRLREEAEAEEREVRELAAQEGVNAGTRAMNDATQRMANYAFWSTWFVGVGTVLLIVTLCLTWMANRAAVKGVKVTERAYQVDQRPWLHAEVSSLTDAKIHRHTQEGDRGPEFTLTVNLKIINSGKTPAQEIEVLVRAGDTDNFRDTIQQAFDEPEAADFYVVGVVAPQSEIEVDFPSFHHLVNKSGTVDFLFNSSLLCVLVYTTRSPGRNGTSDRTTQIFTIEQDNGRNRSTQINTYAVRNAHGQLKTRPGAGVMT